MDYQWTPEAEEILGRFFNRHSVKLCPHGADAAEVHENIRQHIREDAAASGAKLITAERLNRSLSSLVPEAGTDDLDDTEPAPTKPPAILPHRHRQDSSLAKKPLSLGFVLFGVALPAITIIYELISRSCAAMLFDPMPTLWHTLLIVLVPVSNLLIYKASHGTANYRPRLVPILCGISIIVSLYYTILFAPVTPIAAVGILYLGFGFIPLTAIISFCVTLRAATKLGEFSRRAEHPAKLKHAFLAGIVLGITALLVLEAPKYITRIALGHAASGDSDAQRKAIRHLRSFGSRDTLLRACYESSRRWGASGALDTAGWLASYLDWEPVGNAAARRVYFQVTGVPFNQVKPPGLHSRNNRGFMDGFDNFSFDPDQGGDTVGLRLAHLHLQNSRIDTHIDPASALAYTEWTLVFNNMSRSAAEARFQALLPPDGVVSRLTLWVDGEPQEAAFAANQKVKAAYKNVVKVQRRDPVLVTSTGPDRVLVQCFPVLPLGGEIKIRLGITSPIVPHADNPNKGTTWNPRIIERNFNIAKNFGHSLWVQSPGEITSDLAGLSAETGSGKNAHALSGTFTNGELNAPASRFTASGIDASTRVWTEDPFDPATRIVRQSASAISEPVGHLVIVLDTSTGMAEGWQQTKSTIVAFAKTHPATLLVADDEITTHEGAIAIAKALEKLKAGGGKDNATALLDALARARQKEDSAVVWIHAAQPFLLADAERIVQTLERSFTRRRIYSFAQQQGPDLVTAAIHRLTDVQAAPRGVGLATFLNQLSTTGARPASAHAYQRLGAGEEIPEGTAKVWDHLARYWAFTETMRQYHQRTSPGIAPAAAALASKYQLVTPFSGAVVLETQRDFKSAGLEQIDPNSAPSIPGIPEPGSASLLLLALACFVLRRRR